MNIQPGIGLGQIKFGITEDQLISILGKPLSVKEGEYLENSGDFNRELFYDEDLSFTFDSEDNYRLGLITIRHQGHTLFGRDLIGLPIESVKLFISKQASVVPKFRDWSYEDVLNHMALDYDNLGLNLWFDEGLLDEIQCNYLFYEDGNTIKWPE